MKTAFLAWILWALVACNTTYGPGNLPPEEDVVNTPVCPEGSTDPAYAMDNPLCMDPSDYECEGPM